MTIQEGFYSAFLEERSQHQQALDELGGVLVALLATNMLGRLGRRVV